MTSNSNSGISIIADFAKQLPNTPGVYRMYDGNGKVLYVGKARNLKKRVMSYTRTTGQNNRILHMVQQTQSMEFVTTQTETEALLLEANLIKRLRPRYNVLLRDDKSFPYILLRQDHAATQIMKHRGARQQKGQYFGPFASAGAVNRTITALQKAFLLRSCSDSYYEHRTRPCLLYQIKRCSAPCTGEISLEDYKILVEEAVLFLSSKSHYIQSELANKMEKAAEAMDFETAAVYRDRIAALSHIQSHQGIHPKTIAQADVFAIYQEAGFTCIQVFFFRVGQNWGNHAYFPKADDGLELGVVLEAFLTQFYEDRPVPSLILLSHLGKERALIAKAFSERMNVNVRLAKPERGEKRWLVDHSLMNAKEALGRKLAHSLSHKKLLEDLAKSFGLKKPPQRIEVYDNSHIMGTNSVGAMVVVGEDGFLKEQYRKFNIKSQELTPGDDYAMMREVIYRRFSRLQKEGSSVQSGAGQVTNWPDLLLIDGGRGQIKVVEKALKELEIFNLLVIGVAKGQERNAGRETFYFSNQAPFMLPKRDPVLYFVQKLRDEAHRFAITSHRARRKKTLNQNMLDEIPGIGQVRKRALLRIFGTSKAVGKAGIHDLKAVPGISAQIAQTIFDFFHDKDKR